MHDKEEKCTIDASFEGLLTKVPYKDNAERHSLILDR
jgi:hypothetical protein